MEKGYDDIKNPYGTDLIRSTSPLASPPGVSNNVFATGQFEDGSEKNREAAPDNPTAAEAGSSLSAITDRTWTSGWYKSHNYKPGSQGWLLEGAQGFIDVADLRVGRLGITIVQTATGINSTSAIAIESASDASAITVLKTGLGSAFYLRQDGSGLAADILQNGNAPAMRIISNNASAPVVVSFKQSTATSTSFYKIEELYGGSVRVERWVANNANPNTVITAPRGSICQSSDGNVYRNTDGSTAWTAM